MMDTYFIRELIQNSVDAIKVRKEVIEKKGLTFNSGEIKIIIKDYNKTYYCISVIDNGVGMDEYIIRNYLSVAGRSYYNSKDFENEGFIMEPISRFGIGVLSCFMLSDYIEILTNRDPYISGNSEKLKIIIPSKENYFRIEVIQTSIDIGTTFNVFILKEKLTEYKIDKLNITDYVKEIAGFVEFPIEVNELDKEVIINKPSQGKKAEENSNWINLSYDFPIESAIFPQNIQTVKEFFIEKKVFLKEDLKLDRFEGCITFLLPKDENVDIVNIGNSWPINDIKLVNITKKLGGEKRIQWEDNWINYNRWDSRRKAKSLSINKNAAYSVFLNGILLPNAASPEMSPRNEDDSINGYEFNHIDESFLLPQFIVNVPRSTDIKIDLARSSMKNNEKWDKQIWEAFFAYMKETEIKNIFEKSEKERYFKIGRLLTFYRIPNKIILEKLIPGINVIPIPFITSKNKLIYSNIEINKLGNGIRLPNNIIKSEIRLLIDSDFLYDNPKYSGFLNYRNGLDIIAISSEYHLKKSPASLNNSDSLINSFIKKYFVINHIEFIISPLGKDYPWTQEVYLLKDNMKSVDISTIDLTQKDINDFYADEILLLSYKLRALFPRMPKIVGFSKPFSDKLFFTWEYMNKSHPFTNTFFKLLIELYNIKQNKILKAEAYGDVIDKINNLIFMEYSSNDNDSDLTTLNKNIGEISKNCMAHSIKNIIVTEISINDFVMNSFSFDLNNRISKQNYKGFKRSTKKWGAVIK